MKSIFTNNIFNSIIKKPLKIKNATSLSLVFIMLITGIMSGCEPNNESNNGGNSDHSKNTLAEIKPVAGSDRNSILKMAEAYYKETQPDIEIDFKNEFLNIVSSTPDFSGKTKDEKLVREMSLQVGGSILSCNAKNYNLALSAAMVAKDPDSVSAVMNFAAAITYYFDNNVFDSFDEFRKQAKNKYYEDATKVYFYAINLSKEDGKYTNLSLSALTSLGNVFIDMDKSEDAIPLFDNALSIDPNFTPAIAGKQKALFDLKRYDELQLFLGAAIKNQPLQEKQTDHIAEWLEEIALESSENLETLMTANADEIAEFIKTDSQVEVISKADALTLLSKEAEDKIRQRLKETQAKVQIKVPDMSLLFDYKDWKEFFTIKPNLPDASYYIGGEKFWDKMQELADKNEQINEEKQRLEEQYRQKYPREGMEFVGPGIDENTARGMFVALYDKKQAPAAMNPFDYKNPEDVLIQVIVLQRYVLKYQALVHYMAEFQEEVYDELEKKTEAYWEVHTRLQNEYSEKRGKINEREDADCKKMCEKGHNEEMHNRYKSEVHVLALDYYQKFKSSSENSWKDATECARNMYKKYEETLPVIYNDVMKYIMLVSDKEVQEELETQTNLQIMTFIDDINSKIQTFFGLGYVRVFDEDGYAEFDCTSDIMKEEERQKNESEIVEAMQARLETAMRGKEAFDAKIIDENSKFYKEVIAKYDYNVNLGFIQYNTNELRSTTTMGFNFGAAEGSLSQTENHYTGAVTMEGNLELGGGVGSVKSVEIGAAGKFGFTATMDANKRIVPNSVDIRAGLEAGATIGKVVEAKGGIEASVMRGTKAYGNIGLTANELLKDMKIKAEEKRLGRYLTDFEKDAGIFAIAHNNTRLPGPTLWKGDYNITTPNEKHK
jgi:tetratricopeptide (TPR) repeat protein